MLCLKTLSSQNDCTFLHKRLFLIVFLTIEGDLETHMSGFRVLWTLLFSKVAPLYCLPTDYFTFLSLFIFMVDRDFPVMMEVKEAKKNANISQPFPFMTTLFFGHKHSKYEKNQVS